MVVQVANALLRFRVPVKIVSGVEFYVVVCSQRRHSRLPTYRPTDLEPVMHLVGLDWTGKVLSQAIADRRQ